jgi:hypothetical protein
MQQWHPETEQGIAHREGTKDRETGPTSRSKKDAPWGHQAEPTSGDNEIDSRILHRATRTGGRDTVELSAPAEGEKVVR